MPEKPAPPKWGPIFDPAPWGGRPWPPIWQNPYWPPGDPIPWPGPGDPIPFPEKFLDKIRIQDLIDLRLASLEAREDVFKAQFEAERNLLQKQREILSKIK